MSQRKPKKESEPRWRHYNFTTVGAVDDYLYSMLPKRDDVLVEMEDYASSHDVPIVGPAVARLLQQLALMINAKTVFELGSAIGYSTIWSSIRMATPGTRNARANISIGLESPNKSRCTPAMRWSISRSRNSSSM